MNDRASKSVPVTQVVRRMAIDKARRMIEEGARQAARGEVVSGDEVMERWGKKHARLSRKRGGKG